MLRSKQGIGHARFSMFQYLFALLLELQVLIHQPANLFLQIFNVCLHMNNKPHGKYAANNQLVEMRMSRSFIFQVDLLCAVFPMMKKCVLQLKGCTPVMSN